MCLAIPGRVTEIVDRERDIAKVDVTGIKRNVSITLLKSLGIEPGDWVLVHVGFAMSKIDEQEAQETLAMLQELGTSLDDEFDLWDTSQIE
ncbi:HypC/HybG/HupF family hydrogenase formation chaperone [Sulfobacillus thermosulfidooxidans]|uniref:Hydrogenase expression/formation protein HypC n=2 Tax=Sulfobacillus thermosulfidooxidans TaxID=28034 RepID=A0A1W1WG79_SULTA|nr:HypC/HybG/HupF family hydrogenase formation chaperone [Sulfobacillus thermosulfidooxidans]OLZ11320.1 hydrogenase assembly protein HupF [Sulfobacillus thermosulfidooxidans]OLZ14082.1 hydrogenase assembly protein HupF [Sulfobacillus thermosulfidooxidans]OLZ19826.1 hydrogenase assembly protein HupF [Sulfobacillus thermosulfidooxidans]PSR23269.1 MAG: HypC/HybG/HupF family hydrogenase formation chaperone [Sulfobacillus thermosulfidooxidans]SMC04723.1 hydrogenase expression/formation protein HypC